MIRLNGDLMKKKLNETMELIKEYEKEDWREKNEQVKKDRTA